MKYLKIRYIFTLVIVVVLGVSLLVYFFGGLKATALESDNVEFDLTGYIDYSIYDGSGNYIVEYDSEGELNNAIYGVDPTTYEKSIDNENNLYTVTFKLNQNRIVAQNDIYTMFLNENTTIVSVVTNSTCDASTGITEAGFDIYDKSSCSSVYSTALETSNLTQEKSNFSLYYVGSNGKVSPLGFDTYKNSVLYDDLLYGTIKRHYQIKFDIENGIEILYEIGDFTVINSFFPEDFDRRQMEDIFRGNLTFVVNASKVNNNELVYADLAYTWDSECVAYLEENELATATPVYSGISRVDEEGNPIPSRWDLTNILAVDEDDNVLNKLKMEAGIDYNAKDFSSEGASPCVTNPFMNSAMYNSLFTSFYSLLSLNEDEEPYNTDWRLDVENSSPTYQLKATGSIQYQKMFEYFYKEDKTTDPNFFYVKEDKGVKIPVLYDENPYDDIEGEKVPIGGYQARDDDGNFLYDEEDKPVQEVFTKERADLQNDLYGNVVESNSPIFQVGMRFNLTDKGLEATIVNESLKEGLGSNYKNEEGNSTLYSHDLLLSSIDVLPYFTSNKSLLSEGQIILPDGSGAIMTFNSPKDELGYNAYAKPIYGPDKAFTFEKERETAVNERYMLSMYGFLDKTEEKGILAIADRGANQSSIYANFKRADVPSTMNIAYFNCSI